jgi:hypothetical protein
VESLSIAAADWPSPSRPDPFQRNTAVCAKTLLERVKSHDCSLRLQTACARAPTRRQKRCPRRGGINRGRASAGAPCGPPSPGALTTCNRKHHHRVSHRRQPTPGPRRTLASPAPSGSQGPRPRWLPDAVICPTSGCLPRARVISPPGLRSVLPCLLSALAIHSCAAHSVSAHYRERGLV